MSDDTGEFDLLEITIPGIGIVVYELPRTPPGDEPVLYQLRLPMDGPGAVYRLTPFRQARNLRQPRRVDKGHRKE